MKEKVIAYLGCRKWSQRVINKNSKIFCESKQENLFEIKIKQLLETALIDEIFFSTDDEKLIKICKDKYSEELKSGQIIIHQREAYYASSECTWWEYQKYIYRVLWNMNAHILWTHTTSPFLDSWKYNNIISTYLHHLWDYDSLMTVKTIQNYILNKQWKIINNNDSSDDWPATQTLETLYEVDSWAFIMHSKLMQEYENRVWKKVFLYENLWLDSTDIDYPEDFELAKMIWNKLES